MEKSNAGEKEEMKQPSVATCCSSSGNNILLFVYVTPVSMNACVRSQHGAVSLDTMTIIASDRAHCALYICS